MDNPYWHDKFKPHLIDRGEIRLLCFEIDNIVAGSMSWQGKGADLEEDESPEFSILDQLSFRMAESELSKRLLRLALLVRTFDEWRDLTFVLEILGQVHEDARQVVQHR